MCQDPESSPKVGSAGIGRAINSISDVTEPQRGNVSEYGASVGLPSSIPCQYLCHVLKHDVLTSHQPNAFKCLGPEVPVIVKASSDLAVPCFGVGLAGEPGRDDVNVSSPGSGIEGRDVVPDGSGIEAGRVILEPLLQDPLGVFVVLDVADRPGPESGESAGQGESPVS